MSVNLASLSTVPLLDNRRPESSAPVQGAADEGGLRQAFDTFVGETVFGQMLKSMRATVGKPAYFHGGRGEEVFQQQLDQVLVEKITAASADTLSGPMFELFTMPRG